MAFKETLRNITGATSSLYESGKRGVKTVGGDLIGVGNNLTHRVIETTGHAYQGSARRLYEHGRLRYLHTSDQPTFFNQSIWENLSGRVRDLTRRPSNSYLTSVAIPVRIDGKFWRAPKTSRVWELWGPDYPTLLVELEDPNPNLEGEEAVRLTAHGMAFDTLGSQDIAWRLWMPGRFKIKVDVQGTIIEKPQAEMTAGDVVSLLAETVRDQSGGKLTLAHRDLHKALMMISKRSNTLERRWAILDERLKLNKNLVNKPEEVAGTMLTMILVDSDSAQDLVRSVRRGEITGWASLLDKTDGIKNLRVYGSFANLLGEGSRMLPRPSDPDHSYRVPPSVMLGSYQILRYINWVLDNDDILGPMIKEIANITIGNQAKALQIGKAILDARGQGFDEIRKRIERGTPELIAKMGDRTDEMMRQIARQMADQIGSGDFERPQITDSSAKSREG